MRPSNADLIQKIQELKANEHRLRKRAQDAETLLLCLVEQAEVGTAKPEITRACREHLVKHYGEQ